MDKKTQRLISFSIEHCSDAVICIEPEGNIFYVNNAACRLLGYSREDLLCMNMCDIDPDFDATFIFENNLAFMAGELFTQKSHIRKKDGSVFPIDITINLIEFDGKKYCCVFAHDIAFKKKSEEVLRSALNMKDLRVKKRTKELVASNKKLALRIEELEQTEKKLKKSESTLKEAQHIARLGSWELNCETEEVELSDEMYNIYSLEKKTDGNIVDEMMNRTHPDDREKVLKGYKRHLLGGKLTSIEFRIVRPDGSIGYFWAEAKYAVLDKDGKPLKTIGITQDITERKIVEHDLIEKKQELEANARRLEETNAALKVLMQHRDQDKGELETKVISNVKHLIEPYLEELEESASDRQKSSINILKSNLKEVISPFTNTLSNKYFDFTPTEIRIANLIKRGKTTKEIAKLLNVSANTISFHRKNIRKKFDLPQKKSNLRSRLMNLS